MNTAIFNLYGWFIFYIESEFTSSHSSCQVFKTRQSQATSKEQSSSSLTSSPPPPCIIHVLYCWCWGKGRVPASPWTRLHACEQEAARAREYWRAVARIATLSRTFFHPSEGIYSEITGAKEIVLIKQGKSQTLSSVFWFSRPPFALASWFSFFKEGRVVFRRGSWCMLNTVR